MLMGLMSKPAQLIDPKDAGGRRHDLKPPVFDAGAVARADEALKAMGEDMQTWLDADIERLHAARLGAAEGAWSPHALEPLFGAAHDLKGMGATYGYPLATLLAASLCRLIETDAGKAAAKREPDLVCAHVDALRAAVRDRIKTDAHPVGRALVQALEARVAELGVAPR